MPLFELSDGERRYLADLVRVDGEITGGDHAGDFGVDEEDLLERLDA